jgi:dTDP-4-dehydrorhamnose 3,5-epimerase
MFQTTPIADLLIFQPQIWGDERGYFYESYSKATFAAAGIQADFIQDNQARSIKGVLRGLHFQTGEFAQAKLVRCTEGAVLDVAVDLRPDSTTYGKWYSIVLSAENHTQFFVPRGFAHGYAVLTETAVFQYKCDNLYSKNHESGVHYNDPTLNIDWQIDLETAIISEKDKVQPFFLP